MLIIRNSIKYVKNGQNVMKNENFIPKWGVSDHQMCLEKKCYSEFGYLQ